MLILIGAFLLMLPISSNPGEVTPFFDGVIYVYVGYMRHWVDAYKSWCIFGMSVASQLFNMGYEVLAVDSSMENVNLMLDYVTSAICGDTKEESVLKAVGIRNYDCVVVAMGDNLTDSILITLMPKEMGIKQIVCKARDNQHKKVLKKIS